MNELTRAFEVANVLCPECAHQIPHHRDSGCIECHCKSSYGERLRQACAQVIQDITEEYQRRVYGFDFGKSGSGFETN